MKINGKHFRSIWEANSADNLVQLIDQRFLPHQLVFEDLRTAEQAAIAIREMHTRGAPMVGLTAAYGLWLGLINLKANGVGDGWQTEAQAEAVRLMATRPTAVNLEWAVRRVLACALACSGLQQAIESVQDACQKMVNEDAEVCRMIGVHALPMIEEKAKHTGGKPVNILTHCNAGWLACADYGTATSPIYQAHDAGIPVHVWVEETRPRNQGGLTAWELAQHGVPHTVIVDNAGGHLMQHGLVDFVFVGTDRTTRNGDVANKIGTYQKALAAKDNDVPFYVMLPSSSLDWQMRNGLREIPIEERNADEVLFIQGKMANGELQTVRLFAEGSPASNYGFDVTPARLITGLVTERGICPASEAGLLTLFPEQK